MTTIALSNPDNDAESAAVLTPRPSLHRARAIKIPADPTLAAAQCLAFVNGDDAFDRSAALEALNLRLDKLLKADGEEALRELALHLPILSALHIRFAALAVEATKPEHRSLMLRMSVNAQQAFARTVALIQTLRQQQRAQQVRALVHDGDTPPTPDDNIVADEGHARDADDVAVVG